MPKSGPVQTSYEDKLGLYALYKQGALAPDVLMKGADGLSYRGEHLDIATGFARYARKGQMVSRLSYQGTVV